MLNKNRKGVSEVVANVLIVLLVIVGIAVIWSVVKPTIDKGAKGINADCFTVSVEPVSCDLTTNMVKIKRNPGSGTFEDIEIILEDAAENTRKVSHRTPATPVTDTSLAELSTLDLVFAPITGFTPVKANIVITSGGNLCGVTTQPVDCA